VLDFIDRHKDGILGTIIIHLVLATVVLVMKINTLQNRESATELNLLSEEEVKQFLEPEEKKEDIKTKELFSPAEKEMLGAKNIGTNEAEKNASQDIDKMVNDIKNELNIKDQANADMKSAPQQAPDENALPDKDKSKEEKINVSKASNTGIRTFYKGPTTVSYFLEGRYHVNLPIPVYKCQSHGKVVMKITVNQQGYVETLEINRAQSNIPDECILETAERAARSTRFNSISSGPLKQSGTLTYIFVAQ
jgi:hypothetical protein